MSRERTFITGSSGFIGGELTHFGLKRGDNYISLMRPQSIKKFESIDRFGEYRYQERLKIVPGDVTKERFGLTEEAYGILTNEVNNYVHVAGDVSFGDGEDNLMHVNYHGCLNFLNLVKEIRRVTGRPINATIFSSAYVNPLNRGSINEDTFIERAKEDFNGRSYEYSKTLAFQETDRQLKAGELEGITLTTLLPGITIGRSYGGNSGGHRMTMNAYIAGIVSGILDSAFQGDNSKFLEAYDSPSAADELNLNLYGNPLDSKQLCCVDEVAKRAYHLIKRKNPVSGEKFLLVGESLGAASIANMLRSILKFVRANYVATTNEFRSNVDHKIHEIINPLVYYLAKDPFDDSRTKTRLRSEGCDVREIDEQLFTGVMQNYMSSELIPHLRRLAAIQRKRKERKAYNH